MSISALFPGMEAYLDGDVNINNNVTTPEEDAAHEVEAADQTADIATDVGEAETDVKNDDVATQMLLRTGRLYYHVKKYGVDRTFLRLYNQHGELDRLCGIQFPSCESMNVTGNPYSRYSAAFIAAMEDDNKGFWATIWQKIQDAWKWIKDHISALWNRILQFFGVRARDLQKLISDIEKKYNTSDKVTLAKGSKLGAAANSDEDSLPDIVGDITEIRKRVFAEFDKCRHLSDAAWDDLKLEDLNDDIKDLDEWLKEAKDFELKGADTEVEKTLAEVLQPLKDSIGSATTFLNREGALKKMSEEALKKVAEVAKKMKDGADDEKKKKCGELALALTNYIKKTNGSIVVLGKIVISIINAYYKELRRVVKKLKPKEKSADNAGGDESAQSGGDKNATAMFAFL